MILTVTPHTALDRVLFIDEWITGTPMRSDRIVTSVGGKGLDTSVVLRHLGVETVCLAFLAGRTGRELLRLVKGYGIIPDVVWIEGETRVAHVVVETKHHRHSHIIAGKSVFKQAEVDRFARRFRRLVPSAQWVILGGSIPPALPQTLYRDFVQEAARHHVPVLIDAVRGGITESIPARPAVLKMNWEEYEWTFGADAPTLGDLKRQAQQTYHDLHLESLVLTCASEGILAFSAEGAFHAVAPWQEAVNAAGAGDAVSAALAWRFSEGDRWPQALKWAGAVSAATVLTEGTADCRMEDIRRIYSDVQVTAF